MATPVERSGIGGVTGGFFKKVARFFRAGADFERRHRVTVSVGASWVLACLTAASLVLATWHVAGMKASRGTNFEEAASGASDAVNKMASGASDAVNKMASGASDAVNKMASGASDAVNKMASGASDAVNKMHDTVREAAAADTGEQKAAADTECSRGAQSDVAPDTHTTGQIWICSGETRDWRDWFVQEKSGFIQEESGSFVAKYEGRICNGFVNKRNVDWGKIEDSRVVQSAGYRLR